MNYYRNNNEPPPHYAMAQYLLSMGPMPPPTNQELAAAHIQQLLNQGAFEHTYEPGLEVEIPAAPVAETESTLATAATPVRLEFSINGVLPGDFLARVCANMDVSQADAKLGWKASTNAERSLARPLHSDKDVKAAFEYFRPIISSTQRTKKVHMLVVNLAKPAEKVVTAPKVTETAYCNELNIVKGALACEKHSGRNQWCFVRRDDEKGEHCVPLGLEEITLWARKLHEDKAKGPEECELDDKCLTPPKVLHLDELEKVASQREEQNKTQKRNNAPDIHVHMPPMPVFADVLNCGPSNDHHGKRHHDQLSEDNESEDDAPATSIAEVLAILHTKMPDLSYPQYEGALRKQGVAYAKNIDPSDRDFLVKDVGMAKGAVKEFLWAAGKAAKSLRKGKKRARVDDGGGKENE
ncbi:hypothetical protein DFH08DRAFT_703643 [Mycena albidolilacea]|uniref:Uncharacterized protein n=1 Tax=Mycena albidolilacea TaxID=1033008 RepID=A0AAD6ZWQ0_9AGAR|nr:hypothetical protein DFH08DRAFT_703643 [Mycena albidolilacea]